jgi:hypothetical protein
MKVPLGLVKSILTVSSLVAVASITLETKPAAAACLSQPCVTVEVEGTSYDVSYKTGSFRDLESELKNQVWWGNRNLGNSFAKTVGFLLGSDNDYGGIYYPPCVFCDEDIVSGPIFANRLLHYSSSSYGLGESAWRALWQGEVVWELGLNSFEFSLDTPKQYAVASPSVPEPLTLGGTLLALVAGKIARRRLKQR